MIERYEIRLAGSGGQGIILAGVILGEAAAIKEGIYAVQSQSYGPEARGGASRAEVVISEKEIDYPKCTSPDLQVILMQEACDKYAGDIKEGGVLVIDDFYVYEPPKIDGVKIYYLPISKTAREKVGKEITSNIVALGVVAKILERKGILKPQSLREAVKERVPKGTEELNMKAFDLGYELLKEL